MGVAYQGSMSKLVLRFQFVGAYINIYTCPLHCTKHWIYTNLLGVNMVQKSAN